VTPPTTKEFSSGVWGLFHTRFGGPGEKIPIAAAQVCDLRADPGGSIVMRFAGKHKCFFALS
jgi:hypothetical protein